MSYNDNFFNYIPKCIGILLDLERHDTLRAAKNVMINLLVGLDDTEDKAILYGPEESIDLPRHLGQTVSYLANYKEPNQFSVESGLNHVLSRIGQINYDSDQFVFYFVDRYTESKARRIDRVIGLCVGHGLDVRFVVIDLGEGSSELAEVCKKRNMTLIKTSAKELDGKLLREVLDGKN